MSIVRSERSAGSLPAWLPALPAILLAWWTLSLAGAEDPWCFLDFVNLAFHEAGHVIFSPFGHVIRYLGGTLAQLLVPAILCCWFLLKERKPSGGAFCFWWLGQNLVNVARYMADARDLALPLVGGGDHDWNELFYTFGLLAEPRVAAISTATHRIGVLVMLGGVAWLSCFALPLRLRQEISETLASRHPLLGLLLG